MQNLKAAHTDQHAAEGNGHAAKIEADRSDKAWSIVLKGNNEPVVLAALSPDTQGKFGFLVAAGASDEDMARLGELIKRRFQEELPAIGVNFTGIEKGPKANKLGFRAYSGIDAITSNRKILPLGMPEGWQEAVEATAIKIYQQGLQLKSGGMSL
ncbi:MAG: hypothetical protein KGJ06_00330 [Pseudomonadota bacterium]|nr:hypothetical protein [Pseudomonadota bacterium]